MTGPKVGTRPLLFLREQSAVGGTLIAPEEISWALINTTMFRQY